MSKNDIRYRNTKDWYDYLIKRKEQKTENEGKSRRSKKETKKVWPRTFAFKI